MKKILGLLLFSSAFFALSTSAQTPVAPKAYSLKNGGANEKQILMDSLKLSSTAADSVISIRSQAKMQIKSIMSDGSLSDDQKKEKVKPIKQDMKTRLEKYITKDQMAKLQEMQGEMKKNKSN